MKPYVAVFLGVFLAELGDKTQLATLFFATDAALSRWGVLAAAGGALVLSTGLAVTAGCSTAPVANTTERARILVSRCSSTRATQ